MTGPAKRPVVAGWDGSDVGRDALALAGLLARALASPIVAVTAHPDSRAAADEARARLAELPDELAGGVALERRAEAARSPAAALQHVAEGAHPEAVVVGSTHRGAVGRVLPGSTAERLLHGAPCAVAMAPRGYAADAPDGLHVIAVAYDGTDESEQAALEAAALAVAAGATIRLVAVVEPFGSSYSTVAAAAAVGDLSAELRAELEERVRRTVDAMPAETHADSVVKSGHAVEEIVAHAERGADLLVMGSRGYGPLRRALLGGVSARVVAAAPCPVLLMPRGVSAAGPGEGAPEAAGHAPS